jgi:hypothetical protein
MPSPIRPLLIVGLLTLGPAYGQAAPSSMQGAQRDATARITTAQGATVRSSLDRGIMRSGRESFAPIESASLPLPRDDDDGARPADDLVSDAVPADSEPQHAAQTDAHDIMLSHLAPVAATTPSASVSLLLSVGEQRDESTDAAIPLLTSLRAGSAREPLISGSVLQRANANLAAFDIQAAKVVLDAVRADDGRARPINSGVTKAAIARFLAPPAAADEAAQPAAAAADENQPPADKPAAAATGDLIPWQYGVGIIVMITLFAAAFSRKRTQASAGFDYSY